MTESKKSIKLTQDGRLQANANVEFVPLKRLRANPANARTHSKKQIAQITRSIEQFGFYGAILVDENFEILAGHGRWLAAKALNLPSLPVIVVADLSPAKRRALRLADNKIAENAGWDRAKLAKELGELVPLLQDSGLDLGITGFSTAEIDNLLVDLVDPELDPADDVPQVEQRPISRRGDLWELGPHKVCCGDARADADFHRLVGRERAAMVFADPPFNVSGQSVQGRGQIPQREFPQASAEMSSESYTRFLIDALSLTVKFSAAGSIHFVCADWHHLGETLTAGKQAYAELTDVAVWPKADAGQGSLSGAEYELVFAFKCGTASERDKTELGRDRRRRSSVWRYGAGNALPAGRLNDPATHLRPKPVAMVADAMRDCTRRGDIVVDPFLGCGTTVMAAERIGRRGYGLEIDPRYVDVAVRRWQQWTKQDAVLGATDKTFDEIAAERGARGDHDRA